MTSEMFDPTSDPHYAEGWEQDRLTSGRGALERVRTQELLARYLPDPPVTILDVGGGAGVHAHWLADRGYTVHLVDAVLLHAEQASIERDHPLASATVGDARDLQFADSSADAVLLLGPLYHLTERFDRINALSEAERVLKPGGLVFAVAITRFASLLDGFFFEFFDDPAFAGIVAHDLADGQHRNPVNHPEYFTTAYFHKPEDLTEEVAEAGFGIEATLGIEGPSRWLLRDFDAWWNDPGRREKILYAARSVESEPSMLGIGPHIMVVGRKR
jgi:ubiquinone/menaquinone biosynthesis C-methylase UbiE